MARVLNGLHREIKGYSWNWEDSLLLTDPLGGSTMLDTLLTDGENGFWYPQLRRTMGPEHIIHIRMYSETSWQDPTFGRHWNDIEPTVWASECVRRLSEERLRYNGIRPIDDPYVIVSFANEQDLQVEGHLLAATMAQPHIHIDVYREIWTWGAAVVRAFKGAAPSAKCRIGTNPLAGGHDVIGYPPDWEYQMPEFAAYSALCDINLLHAYFNPDGSGTRKNNGGFWVGLRGLRSAQYRETEQGYEPIGGIPDPGGIVTQYPGKPWAVTEFGNFRHYDTTEEGVAITMQGYREVYQAYSARGCVLVTPFIWNDGGEHRENRLRDNGYLVTELQHMQRFPAGDWPPAEQEPGGGSMTYEWQLAFADFARAHPEVGKAVSGISYVNPANPEGRQMIWQFGENGKLEYDLGSGKVYFFKAASKS